MDPSRVVFHSKTGENLNQKPLPKPWLSKYNHSFIAFDSQVDRHSISHRWSSALCSDWKNKIADTSSWNLHMAVGHPLGAQIKPLLLGSTTWVSWVGSAVWLRGLLSASLRRFSGGINFVTWTGSSSGSFRRSWWALLGEGIEYPA